jgi:rod shape-determining protein MreB and related proteins
MIRRDLAIDLGTANTLVYQRGRGVLYEEPTVVAITPKDGSVLALGREAWDLVARTPGSAVAVRPLRRGAITDFDVTRQMIRFILRRIGIGRLSKPRVLVCVPSSLTPVERRAVEEALLGAGAKSVSLVEEPLAAAIGAGLPIQDAVGNMVVDVGGGTSEMAMVALGGIVTGKAIEVGGFDMDVAIQQHVRRHYGMAIGEMTAERVKIDVGSAYPAADVTEAEVRGRDLKSGLPRTVSVAPEDIRVVLGETVQSIVDATRTCLAESPPELAHDVLETGLFLTGGGGLLRGLDMRLAQECEVPVHVTEDPLATVVLGAGQLLEFLPEYGGEFMHTQSS